MKRDSAREARSGEAVQIDAGLDGMSPAAVCGRHLVDAIGARRPALPVSSVRADADRPRAVAGTFGGGVVGRATTTGSGAG